MGLHIPLEPEDEIKLKIKNLRKKADSLEEMNKAREKLSHVIIEFLGKIPTGETKKTYNNSKREMYIYFASEDFEFNITIDFMEDI
jgi:2'-5' RNA ligase